MSLKEEISKIFPTLELILGIKEMSEFKNTSKNDLYMYHFGLGLWIRNNLLTEESKLYKLFIENNILNEDDMSSLVIKLFHEYVTVKNNP